MEYDNDRIIRPSYRIELFYWGVLALFNPLFNALTHFPLDRGIWPLLLMVSIIVLPIYIIYSRWLIPKFLFRKKLWIFYPASLAFFLLIQFLLWMVYGIIHGQLNDPQAGYFDYTGHGFVRESLWTVFNLLLALAISFIKKAMDEKDEIAELQESNIYYRLKYLRAQMNPHFLFNTLNSIYSLSMQQSDKAPEVVLRLSEVMRYLIDDCNEPSILLTREIDFIRNYIEIERVRHQADIRFTVEGDPEGISIEPFLFISFIENGFTHAFHGAHAKPFMYITVKCEAGKISLTVINNTNIDLETQARRMDGSGIRNSKSLLELLYPGSYDLQIIQTEQKERQKSLVRLKNARERLKLLYPDSHTLDVILNNNVFTVSLILKTRAA